VKSKVVWLVVALVAAPLFPVSAAYAGFLDELIYNSGSTQTYSYNVTNSAQPQYPAAIRHQGPAYTSRPMSPQQPVVGRQLVAPRVAYQQPLAQNRPNAQQAPSSQAVSKKKPIKNAAANTVRRSVKAQAPVQRQQMVRSYQPSYPPQARPVFPQTYNQPQPTGYYANPYQPRYATTPNYYQGYSYNSWGSSGQACPPGRA